MKGDARKRAKSQKSESSVSSRDTNEHTKPATAPKQKLDVSGLYDLQQVKRLLDDEVIAVSPISPYLCTVEKPAPHR